MSTVWTVETGRKLIKIIKILNNNQLFRSALLSACWQGHLVIADILLTAGASVNHQCGQGRVDYLNSH